MTETVRLAKAGFDVVNIRAKKVSSSFVNALRVRNKGTKKTSQDTTTPVTKITDKKKYAIKFVVTGVLSSDTESPNLTAQQKFDELVNMSSGDLGMIFKKGDLRLYYRDNYYDGSIENLKIDDVALRKETSSGIQRYDITFTFVYGTVK